MNSIRLWRTILIHAGIWLAIVASMVFLFPFDQRQFGFFLGKSLIGLALYAALFYMNFLWLIDAFFFKRKFVPFIIINLSLVAIMTLVKSPWIDHFFVDALPMPTIDFKQGPPPKEPGLGFAGLFVIKDWISYLVPICMALIIAFVQRWINDEKRMSQKQNEQLQSELNVLRYQLQPHFFFNALNTIYALTEVDPKQAQETIHGFSKLMRYMLYESDKSMVDLADELEFIENYIRLMRLRLPSNVVIDVHFPEQGNRQGKVIPLVFLPIVENAFKHGISLTQSAKIEFRLEVLSNSLVFQSTNSNYAKIDENGSGIGLENLRKRLELSYPNKFSFDLAISRDDFRSHLIIPKNGL